MKLTSAFYIKRLLKSKTPSEFSENIMKYWGFILTRSVQAIEFRDPFLLTK